MCPIPLLEPLTVHYFCSTNTCIPQTNGTIDNGKIKGSIICSCDALISGFKPSLCCTLVGFVVCISNQNPDLSRWHSKFPGCNVSWVCVCPALPVLTRNKRTSTWSSFTNQISQSLLSARTGRNEGWTFTAPFKVLFLVRLRNSPQKEMSLVNDTTLLLKQMRLRNGVWGENVMHEWNEWL